jgi:hypothetical protein
MHDLFAAAPKDLQHARLQEYEQYLRARDGELNLEARTLAKRETSIARFESAPASREMDAATFRRQYVRFDRRHPPDEEMMLLLTLVKVNAAEAYGVSRNFQRTLARALDNGDDCELRILCEEGYHTRILLSSARHYGIEVKDPYTPPSALRVLIGGIATAPMAIAKPLTLAGEILGTLVFLNLLKVAQRVLKHAPEVRDALEERLIEIAADERGHISYNRMTMGPAALAQTRLILPVVAKTMATAMPEAVACGAYPHDVLRDLPLVAEPRLLPEAVRRESFVA